MKALKKVKFFIRRSDRIADKVAEKAAEVLIENKLEVFVEPHAAFKKGFSHFSTIPNQDADIAVVFGGDGSMLRAVSELGSNQKPIIGVSTGHRGYLMQSSVNGMEGDLAALAAREFEVTRKTRLVGSIAGETLPAALNEYTIVANKPVSLLRYSLFLGSNRLWDEEADGVIIATPTGSTGYAESSGGVSLYNDPEVLEIVPLSPVDKRARPIVVKDSEVVSVKNILSPGHQVVIDGITRVRTHSKEVIVRKSRHPALFVKLRPRVAGDSSTKQGLPPSARLVVKVLESQGNLTHKDLEKETGLPGRTLRDTLGKLISKDVIGKKVFVSDPRQNTYFLRRKK